MEEFSKDIRLSFHSYTSSVRKSGTPEKKKDDDDIIIDSGIYILQTIKIDDNDYTWFFDNGCSDMVCRHEAVQRLEKKAIKEIDGPIILWCWRNIR